MPNTILKRWNGSAFEELYPKTTVTQISATGTPGIGTVLAGNGAWVASNGHSHGNINLNGQINSTTITPADQDRILLADASNSGTIERGIIIGTATTTFLRNDGTWATPAGAGTVTNVTAGTQISGMAMTITNGTSTPSIATSINSAANFRTSIDAPATSHASSATTFGVGTNANYGHVRGATRLTGASDGEAGVTIVSGIAYATKTLRVNSIAQQTFGATLDLDSIDGSLLRFVEVSLLRTEGGITYHIGSIVVDVNALPTHNFGTNPTVTTGMRWRLNSRNSSNTQLTLPIFMWRNTLDNVLRIYVDNSTSATYDYECIGYN
jgi:hypothetical protein